MTLEEFEFLKEFGKRKKEVGGIDIDVTKLPFIFVKGEFLDLVQNDKVVESVTEALKHLSIKNKKLTSKEVLSIFLHLYDELLTENGIIYKLENEYLSSTPNPQMISAGVSMLQPFNNHLTLLSLCKELNMSFHDVSKEPYHFLLDVQVALFRQNKVKENYNNILLKQKK